MPYFQVTLLACVIIAIFLVLTSVPSSSSFNAEVQEACAALCGGGGGSPTGSLWTNLGGVPRTPTSSGPSASLRGRAWYWPPDWFTATPAPPTTCDWLGWRCRTNTCTWANAAEGCKNPKWVKGGPYCKYVYQCTLGARYHGSTCSCD